MSDTLATWLDDLLDEYPGTKRSDQAIARLARVFRGETAEIMQAAVDSYLLERRFFPLVADLAPYVAMAREQARGVIDYNQIGRDDLSLADRRRLHEANMARLRLWQSPLPACDRCGERSPDLADCPFCADLDAMAATTAVTRGANVRAQTLAVREVCR
jgi:hypothetical protein